MKQDRFLYEHNEPVYEEFISEIKRTRKAFLVTATGTGKSYIISQYLMDTGLKALVVVPYLETKGEWEKIKNKYGLSVEFSTYLALKNIKNMKDYDVIVFDEAHHLGAPEWGSYCENAISQNNKLIIIGATATNIRYLDGGQDVSEIFWDGQKIFGYELEEAIDKKILPGFRYVCTALDIEKSISEEVDTYKNRKFDDKKQSLYEAAVKSLQLTGENVPRAGAIIDKYLTTPDEQKGIIFVGNIKDIKDAETFAATILKTKSWCVHSGLSKKSNKDTLQEFEKSQSGVLIAINMINEGLHIDGVNYLVMFRRTTSPILFKQQIGRVLATNNIEKAITIFDFVGNINTISQQVFSTKNLNVIIEKDLSSSEKIDSGKTVNQIIVHDYMMNVSEALNKLQDITLQGSAMCLKHEREIREYAAQGFIVTEIADKIGANRKTLARFIKAKNIDVRRGTYISDPLTDEQIAGIYEGYKQGLTRNEIKDKVNCTSTTLEKFIDENNIDLPARNYSITLSNEDIKFALNSIKNGVTFSTCAKQMGKNKSALNSALVKKGIQYPLQKRGVTDEELAELEQCRQEGLTICTTARKLGMSKSKVKRYSRVYDRPFVERYISFSDKDLDRIQALADKGLTVSEAAKELGSHRENLDRFIKKKNIHFKQKSKLTDDEKNKIIEMVKSGKSAPCIAKELDVKENTVRNIAYKNNMRFKSHALFDLSDIPKIQALADADISLSAASKELGCDDGILSRFAKLHNIVFTHSKPLAGKLDEIQELIKQGVSLSEICEKYGAKLHNLKRLLRKHEISY